MGTAATKSPQEYLDVRGVAELFGCSARHIARLVEDEEFPPPVKLGHLRRWPRQQIQDWIEQQQKKD